MAPRRMGIGALVGAVLVAGALTAPTARADAPGLVAAYGFDETTGTSAVDASGLGNTGTLSGATRSAGGKYGSALSFDGVNDRVDVADASSLDLSVGMTLEAWVKPAVSSDWRTVVIKERPAGLAYALYSSEDSGRPSVHGYTSAEYDTRGTAALPVNAWSHVAGTYDGATLRLYVNGAQVSSRTLSSAMTVSSSPLRIGGNAIWGEWFSGLIDEVRVYNQALTAGEVQADMNAPITPTDTTAPTMPTGLSASVIGGNNVQLSWTVSTDESGIGSYRVHRGTSADFTPTPSNQVSSSIRSSVGIANSPTGTHYYKVVAIDTFGNVSAPSDAVAATVAADTTAPTILRPAVCDTSISSDGVLLSADATDEFGVTRMELLLDGTSLAVREAGRVFATINARAYANGPHTLTVKARDAAGNESTSDCTVTVANPVYTVPFTAPANGATVARDSTVTLTADPRRDGNAVPNNARVQFKVNGQNLGGLDSTAPFSVTWTPTALGSQTLTAVMYYDIQTEPVATTSITVTVVDGMAPSVSSLVNGSVSCGTVTGLALIGGVAQDDTTMSLLSLELDGEPFGEPVTTTIQNLLALELPWDTTQVADGAHVLTVFGRDAAGNERTKVCNLTVANAAAPAAPTNLAAAVTDDDVALTWSAAPGAASYRVYRGTSADFTPSYQNRIATVTTTSFTDSNRATGTYHYKVVTFDSASRQSLPSNLASATIAPDTTPPTVSVLGVCDGSRVLEGDVTLQAQAADTGGAIASLKLRLDGTDLSAGVAGGALQLSWNSRTVANGAHVLTAFARDAAGNETVSAQCPVTIQNVVTGLVAAYGFDEATGATVADRSGNGNTGTINGATRTTAGRFGGALAFDGVNDLVQVADASSLDLTSGLTIEAWVRPATAAGSWRAIVMKERSGGLAYALYGAANADRPNANIVLNGNELELTGPSALPLNTWTHVAITLGGSTLRLYVDGAEVASRTAAGTIATSNGVLTIGGNAVWSEWFNGLIDEVRIYDRALSAADVAADKDRPVG